MLGLWVRKGRDAKNAIRKESVGKFAIQRIGYIY